MPSNFELQWSEKNIAFFFSGPNLVVDDEWQDYLQKNIEDDRIDERDVIPIIIDKTGENLHSELSGKNGIRLYDFDKDDSIECANTYEIFSYTGEKMYLVDLSKKFNSSYVVDDESLIDISSISSLKVVNGTLIKIENNVAVSKAVGIEEINKVLFNK